MTQPRLFIATLVAIGLAAQASSQIVYVDATLATGAGDGSSWDHAFQGQNGLQDALAAAAAGEQIWVATGVYLPDASGDRDASFTLKDNVEIYGGLQPGATSLGSRPDFNTPEWDLVASTLSGDLLGNDTASASTSAENSLHVVRTGGTDASAVLDGFAVVGGNANGNGTTNDRGAGVLCLGGDAPTIRNCRFSGHRSFFGGAAGYVIGSPSFFSCAFVDNLGGVFGGAINIPAGRDALFDGCLFQGNQAARGGAMEIIPGGGFIDAVRMVNCLFVGNVATGGLGGGAINVASGNASSYVVNCTIVGNEAPLNPVAGIRVLGFSNLSVTNSILWGNTGSGGAQGAANQVSLTVPVNYSIVQGGATGGVGNLMSDPEFVDPVGMDYGLSSTSPAIDAGDNGAFAGALAAVAADFVGGRRFFDAPTVPDTGAGSAPIVDMGIVELTTNVGAVFCTDALPNSTGVTARIDATGSASLAANDLTLVATGMPLNAFGYFLVSRDSGFVPLAGGSQGNLCLGGEIGRYVAPAQIGNTGATGSFELALDLNLVPQPTGFVSAAVGDTWRFQVWHRDSFQGAPTSNFTDGLRVRVEG